MVTVRICDRGRTLTLLIVGWYFTQIYTWKYIKIILVGCQAIWRLSEDCVCFRYDRNEQWITGAKLMKFCNDIYISRMNHFYVIRIRTALNWGCSGSKPFSLLETKMMIMIEYIYTGAVFKFRGLTSLLWVGTLWRCGDGLFFRSTSLGKRCASYNAPPTSPKRAADRWSLRNFLPWSSLFMVGKAQKSHGARSGLYGGCSNGGPPIHFSQAEHRIQFRSRPMRFLGFSNHGSTVCSTFSRSGWSVVRRALLAKRGTSKKRPSSHLHKVPTRSNKVSPRNFQTALIHFSGTKSHLTCFGKVIQIFIEISPYFSVVVSQRVMFLWRDIKTVPQTLSVLTAGNKNSR
jgi:hypothetical protein